MEDGVGELNLAQSALVEMMFHNQFQVWGAGTVDVRWKLYAKHVEYVR